MLWSWQAMAPSESNDEGTTSETVCPLHQQKSTVSGRPETMDWGDGLLWKHENLSSDPQNACKGQAQYLSLQFQNSSEDIGRWCRQEIPGSSWTGHPGEHSGKLLDKTSSQVVP